MLSHVRLFTTPRTVARQAPLSMGFPKQKHWSGLPLPFPENLSNPGIKLEPPPLPATAKSLQLCPHRRQPTRLPHPWDSPGKNTGAGCHFLLQCMKEKSESEVAQSCATLSDSMDGSLPDSSIHGIFQARVPEWGAIAFSEIQVRNSFLSELGLKTRIT